MTTPTVASASSTPARHVVRDLGVLATSVVFTAGAMTALSMLVGQWS